jgi:hypothetical protein
MAEYTSGMPMSIGGFDRLWKGGIRTNGMLMKSVDGRIPSLVEGYSRIVLDAGNVLYAPDVIPWGNAVWRDVKEVSTRPGIRYAQAPATGPCLVGVFEFNQGWQASNPIQPYGMPSYSTGAIIRKGLVGYEHAMKETGNSAEYLKYLQGDRSADVLDACTFYAGWVAKWQSAGTGSKLAIFFENETGFPIVAVVGVADLAKPVLSDAVFGGFAEVIAKDHERIYFEIDL